jgi:hypothetical protein
MVRELRICVVLKAADEESPHPVVHS